MGTGSGGVWLRRVWAVSAVGRGRYLKVVGRGDLWGYRLEVVLGVLRRWWIGIVGGRGGLVGGSIVLSNMVLFEERAMCRSILAGGAAS